MSKPSQKPHAVVELDLAYYTLEANILTQHQQRRADNKVNWLVAALLLSFGMFYIWQTTFPAAPVAILFCNTWGSLIPNKMVCEFSYNSFIAVEWLTTLYLAWRGLYRIMDIMSQRLTGKVAIDVAASCLAHIPRNEWELVGKMADNNISGFAVTAALPTLIAGALIAVALAVASALDNNLIVWFFIIVLLRWPLQTYEDFAERGVIAWEIRQAVDVLSNNHITMDDPSS